MSARACVARAWEQSLRLVGDPVDVITGAQTFFETDFRSSGGSIPFAWVRHYDSRRHEIDRGVGPGFRLAWDVELRFDLDGMTFLNREGEEIAFSTLEEDGDSQLIAGYELERVDPDRYHIHPPDEEPSIEFRFDGRSSARPARCFFEAGAHPSIRFEYEPKGDRLIAVQLDSTRRVVFEYSGNHVAGAVCVDSSRVANGGAARSQQRLVRYAYDDQGRLVEAEDAYGGVLRYEYDRQNRLARAVDRQGYSFYHEYDGEGRCVHTRGEDVEDYRFEFKPLEGLTIATRADGAITQYWYDQQKCLVQVIDPCGGVTAYLKDDRGRITAEVDPNGNQSEILYDERYLPYAKRDPLGHVRLIPTDPTPHPLSHELPKNPCAWEQGTWAGKLDAFDSVAGAGRAPAYDDVWARYGYAVGPDASQGELVTDAQGLALREQRRDGKVRRWTYTFNGYYRRYVDFDGKQTSYEYGSWNHLLRATNPLGGVTEYGYAAHEHIANVVDPGGTRSEYEYDAKDRLIAVRRHGRIREQYVYDAADNLIEKRDERGRPLLTFAIGPGNLMKQRQLASGGVQDFEYTTDGRLARAKNEAGCATFEYSAFGQRTADERDGRGVRHRFAGSQVVETVLLGKFATRYLRVNATTVIVVDPAGESHRLRRVGPGLSERSSSNEGRELVHYDGAGRCLAKIATGPGFGAGVRWVRRFAYSGEGDLLSREDSSLGTTRYEHDDGHRLAKTVQSDGSVQDYAYDAAGNLIRGSGLAAQMQSGNRLFEANGSLFTYDARDRVATRQAPQGKIEYQYDSRDFLVGIDGPGLRYEAVHDGLGRRTRKTVNGATWTYYWDTDRLAAEVFPDGRLRVYVYPDASALVPFQFLEYRNRDADPATGQRYHVFTDHLGCPELVLDDAGNAVWKARVDPYGTARVLLGEDFHQPLRWPGHYFDAETGLHENRFRTYSPELGRYLQSDPAGAEGGLNLYAYTENPLRSVDLNGLAQACPAHVRDCPHRREGGPDAEGPPLLHVSPEARKLAAGNRNNRAARRARKRVVSVFLAEYGQEWDPNKRGFARPTSKQIEDQLKGHDMTKPVVVGPPPPLPDNLYQWQHPAKGNQGSYYGEEHATPAQLGIASASQKDGDPAPLPKTQKAYARNSKARESPYLQSVCAPCNDDWSIPGQSIPTPGGGTQRVIPSRDAYAPIS